MAKYFYLDFETRSEVELKQVGALNYAAHPSTSVISISYCVDDGAVHRCRGADFKRWPVGVCFVAHNIEFEESILAAKFNFRPTRWLDTMALAAAMSLPLNLEQLAQHFGLAKDMTGHRKMLKLARPRRKSKTNSDLFWEPETAPDDFDAMYDYNQKDVEVMRSCHKRMLSLSTTEKRLNELSRRLNARGVRVDLNGVSIAQSMVASSTTALTAKMSALTGCSPRSSKKLASWLKLPNVQKRTIALALEKKSISPSVRWVLEARTLLGQSSVGKLAALSRRTSSDGRLRSSLVYMGAQRTGRWSSRGVQLQNLKRGLGSLSDDAFGFLLQGKLDNPLKWIPEMMRGFFLGPFIVGDYAQIEARVLAWMAGDTRQVEQWRTGVDLYKEMAARVYNKPVEKVNDHERFIGKSIILGCGYGMGGAVRDGKQSKFQRSLEEKNVYVDEAFALRAVTTYRERYPKIKRFWDSIGGAFGSVLSSGGQRSHPSGVTMERCSIHGVRYLAVTLPSGRKLLYANPTYNAKGEIVVYSWRYKRPDKLYGGKLVENIVQATARDLMADAMLRMDEQNFPLVLTVHDEIVSEDDGRVELFTRLMKETPSWAKGLPVDVEVFQCARYRK
jgi:DNA polymerase bacteriophage-type